MFEDNARLNMRDTRHNVLTPMLCSTIVCTDMVYQGLAGTELVEWWNSIYYRVLGSSTYTGVLTFSSPKKTTSMIVNYNEILNKYLKY